MPLFSYTARDASGDWKRGTIEALSAQGARSALGQLGLVVETLVEEEEESLDAISPLGPPTYFPPRTPPEEGEETPNQSPDGSGSGQVEENGDHPSHRYFPLLETLRLYAGWLLAWYFLIFAFGSYQYLRELPYSVPLLEDLFLSPLTVKFAFGAFLFLLVTSVFRLKGKKVRS